MVEDKFFLLAVGHEQGAALCIYDLEGELKGLPDDGLGVDALEEGLADGPCGLQLRVASCETLVVVAPALLTTFFHHLSDLVPAKVLGGCGREQ